MPLTCHLTSVILEKKIILRYEYNMYKQCRTEQSAKRQRAIEKALERLMLTRRIDEITVSELCDKSEIPRKAFYRYFDSIDGALHAMIDHTMSEFHSFGSRYTIHERRSLQRDIEQYFIFWKERRDFLDALDRSSLLGFLIQKSLNYSVSDMMNPEKFLPHDGEWDRSQVFKFAVCGLMTMMIEWYKGGFVTSTTEMARLACRVLSEPLFPNIANIIVG